MNGIVLIDKPKGVTSFHVTACVRKKLGQKRVGHAGTLDPLATGVLPVMAGQATRLIDRIPEREKRYIASCRLGVTTDTLDCDGTVLETRAVPKNIDFETILGRFRGEIFQVPPMYSAISKNGVRLYELARKGLSVEREARKVTISNLDLVSYEKDTFALDVTCSKGTYIRTLIDDIGREVGCGAMMTDLRRLSSNGFSVEDCISLDAFMQADDFMRYIQPPDIAVMGYPKAQVTPKQQIRFLNGGGLSLDRVGIEKGENAVYRVYGTVFLGLGEIKDEELKPVCILNS